MRATDKEALIIYRVWRAQGVCYEGFVEFSSGLRVQGLKGIMAAPCQATKTGTTPLCAPWKDKSCRQALNTKP